MRSALRQAKETLVEPEWAALTEEDKVEIMKVTIWIMFLLCIHHSMSVGFSNGS
jgi:hypothetical protein